MSRLIIGGGCLTVVLLVAAPAWSTDRDQSTTVELPAGDNLFPGEASAEAINNNCLACHSADMVLNQPALPKATWEAKPHKRINVYKAPIDKADVPAIVAYLEKIKGKQ